MKKECLSLVLGGFLCGVGCAFFLQRINQSVSHINKEFVYLGEINQQFELDNYDTIYAKGVDPYGVKNKPNGILPNDSLAVEMAKIVLFPIYGKKEIEKHKPYQVKLINNEIWSIKGQLDNNHEGGTFSILINKSDGKVLAISHSK